MLKSVRRAQAHTRQRDVMCFARDGWFIAKRPGRRERFTVIHRQGIIVGRSSFVVGQTKEKIENRQNWANPGKLKKTATKRKLAKNQKPMINRRFMFKNCKRYHATVCSIPSTLVILPWTAIFLFEELVEGS